jgi:putative FmdB family regulatory protein
MPIYEYRCNSCNETHEIIQKISDDPLTHCPKCGGAMKKLISSPAIQFKGSGFYKTDYASSASKPSAEAMTETASGDSKPAPSSPSSTPKGGSE